MAGSRCSASGKKGCRGQAISAKLSLQLWTAKPGPTPSVRRHNGECTWFDILDPGDERTGKRMGMPPILFFFDLAVCSVYLTAARLAFAGRMHRFGHEELSGPKSTNWTQRLHSGTIQQELSSYRKFFAPCC
ncbi:hypothetical protein BDW75DRAFT_24711 [Aspergillus navahoensis]